MKLHFLKYDALASLRANVEGNLEKYRLPVNDWIYEFFGEEEPFGEFMTTVGDISLVCTEKEQGKADVQNVITLYSAMMNITDTQASDERLWAGMCHGDMWEFLNKRWEASTSKKITKEDVLSRYFYGQGRRRSLITNTLAKLWWVGRLTYDPDRKDPFELTHYFEDDFSRKTLILFSSNYMSSRPVALGLLSALNDLERVTKQAYAMVAYYGMSDHIGNLSFYDSSGQSDMTLTKPYSERTAQEIDTEAKALVDSAYQRALDTLQAHREGLTRLAELLLEREVIFAEDLEKIFGKRKGELRKEMEIEVDESFDETEQ